ncbi:MAG: DUF1549 domain-containing protein [Planctomycetes bacterium]|nr:DUF1549 domain-containing protein [Planctomycetota bacterium]MBM4056661.1 DUF1549 domain-containing protein [Planctomycetota bacterium]
MTSRPLPPDRAPIARPGVLPWLAAMAMVGTVAAGLAGAAERKPVPRRQAVPPSRLPKAVTDEPRGTVLDIAPVDRSRRAAVAAAAARIDELVAAGWQARGVEGSRPLDDARYVRRIYLELGGRIPTHDETVAFLADDDKAKRARLVEDLLGSPDYVSHFYNYWADILRLTERPQRALFCEPYLDWVKRSIAANRPFDQWVHEMLTADGKVWDNPAVGFQLRDLGMPLPYVDNTVRVFLGTQIGCAQCHDHPFDSWTQHQFYELAAFTAGTRGGFGGKLPKEQRQALRTDATAKAIRGLVLAARREARDGKVDNGFIQFLQANGAIVSHHDQPLRLPHDYKYDDAAPNDTVAPKVLWGEVPSAAEGADGRERFAAWVTDHDNRQFARTIANRLWKKVMGVGLVEPVDDFRAANPPSHPELLEHLTDLVLELDFDLREFVRVLVSTGTFARRAVVHDPAAGTPFAFPGPALKRMTAEQLWDSILTLVAADPWDYQRPTADAFAAAADLDLAHGKVSLDDAERAYRRYLSAYGPRQTKLQLQKQYGYQGQVLARASELPTPLPLGHFLRQFGQSDRESIEGGRTVATIPQMLAMFNGPITHAMLERGSVIHGEIVAGDPRAAVDVIFLSVLSRTPDAEDRRLAIAEITSADNPATGVGNVIWALLNTREFLFIQ